MSTTSVRSATANSGNTLVALVAMLFLLLSLFALAGPVAAQGGVGEADCPEGTTFLINYDQADIEVGDQLIANVVVTAVTESGGELTSVTVQNNTDANVTIAVKGGSDQVGNFLTIAAGASATISVTDNPTISNLSVCEGPEDEETPTLTLDKVTANGDDEFSFTLGGEALEDTLSGADPALLVASEAGDYTIGEDLTDAQIDAGWALTSVECSGNAVAEVVDSMAGTVTVTVGADEDVTCTFTNTRTDEGEEPGGGGPGQNETPREGTQGGNPLPNTATSPTPTGSVPAALLALLMLAGLGAAGYAVRAEAQRRR